MTIYSLDVLLPDLEPVCFSMSSSNSCFLTCIQISQEAGQVVLYSHLFQNFPQFIVIHTVKGFGIVNKAEVDIFLDSLFLMIQWMLAILSLVPLPFLKPAWTSGSSWFTCCWSLAWRILSITLRAFEMSEIVQYLNILWHCLLGGLEWKLTFSSPVAPTEFSKFAGLLSSALSQHNLLGFQIAQLEFHYLHLLCS